MDEAATTQGDEQLDVCQAEQPVERRAIVELDDVAVEQSGRPQRARQPVGADEPNVLKLQDLASGGLRRGNDLAFAVEMTQLFAQSARGALIVRYTNDPAIDERVKVPIERRKRHEQRGGLQTGREEAHRQRRRRQVRYARNEIRLPQNHERHGHDASGQDAQTVTDEEIREAESREQDEGAQQDEQRGLLAE